MSTDSRPTVDLLYVLRRRGISFERWCRSVGIKTRKDFVEVQTEIERKGEYHFSKEMLELCLNLPQDPEPLFLRGQKPQESIEHAFVTKTPTLPPPAFPTPLATEEDNVSTKKTKKSVST